MKGIFQPLRIEQPSRGTNTSRIIIIFFMHFGPKSLLDVRVWVGGQRRCCSRTQCVVMSSDGEASFRGCATRRIAASSGCIAQTPSDQGLRCLCRDRNVFYSVVFAPLLLGMERNECEKKKQRLNNALPSSCVRECRYNPPERINCIL